MHCVFYGTGFMTVEHHMEVKLAGAHGFQIGGVYPAARQAIQGGRTEGGGRQATGPIIRDYYRMSLKACALVVVGAMWHPTSKWPFAIKTDRAKSVPETWMAVRGR